MYSFPLQKVLDYRIRLEEKEQLALARLHGEKEALVKELDKLREHLRAVLEEQSCDRQQVDISGMILACDYIGYLANQVKAGEEGLFLLEERLRDQTKLTEKAMQDRKVMDTLREKGLFRHQKEEQAAEQKVNDEIAKYTYLRGLPSRQLP